MCRKVNDFEKNIVLLLRYYHNDMQLVETKKHNDMKNKLLTTHSSQWNGKLCSFKSLLLLVAMLLVATSNSFAQASFETIDGIRYLLDSDAKTATVVPLSGDQKYSGDVVVPEKVKATDGVEYPVTAFGENAFKGCDNLTKITIPYSVTTLGNYCFSQCSDLNNVTIPLSVTTLGKSCFMGCSRLTNVSIPSSVTTIGDFCFQECKGLTNITLPSSVKTLGRYCFSNCYKLANITIPSSVTTLGDWCFWNCSSLTSITISSSVATLGESCFQNCHDLNNVIIPSSVTTLGESCFSNCYGLTSITLSSSLMTLDNYCFSGCSGLTSITIPLSVKEIGYKCFSSCGHLESTKFKGECPNGTINSSIPTTCILYVPKAYLQDYKDALGNKYPYIYASKDDGDQGEDKPVTACTTPTITYSDGELQFASATEGAQYHYTITDADIKNDAFSEDGKVQLTAAYNITAYATADGYKQSDKATAVLYWVKANANLENGTSTSINQVKTRGIVATSHDGIVTLSGLDNGEEVRFYAIDGKQIGTAKAIDGVVSQAVSSASIVIAKIGGQAIKIAVK